MNFDFDALFGPASRRSNGFPRMPTICKTAMVATSHPLATRSGLRALERGGNAIDAVVAAATTLTVAEPGENGPGGDAFAIVWFDGKLHGINGSGRAPRSLPDPKRVADYGPSSVTVPGAVALWADLLNRFGRLGLDSCLETAIDLAQNGLVASARTADRWAQAEREGRAPFPAPRAGEEYAFPQLGKTLQAIAEGGPRAFYEGSIAEAIAEACWLSVEDLALHESQWTTPLRLPYGPIEVCELPPNGQGAAALLALAILEGIDLRDPVLRLHYQIEAMKLAFADAHRYLADSPLPEWLLDPDHISSRRALIDPTRAGIPRPSIPPSSETVYLCCVDGDRNAASMIQSVYAHFGSGVLAGDTGVILQNRAAGFASEEDHPNRLEPGKRPYHTIIPGFLLEKGDLLGPFGVMGGPMQPQGHLQVIQQLVDHGSDPQAALDAPRFKLEDGPKVLLEPGLWEHAALLRELGHAPIQGNSPHPFGVGQMIVVANSALVGGSDGRGDGHAGGF